jgi:hypothetical protein
MADSHFRGIDFCLVGDVATVARPIDFHQIAPPRRALEAKLYVMARNESIEAENPFRVKGGIQTQIRIRGRLGGLRT